MIVLSKLASSREVMVAVARLVGDCLAVELKAIRTARQLPVRADASNQKAAFNRAR